MDSNKGYIVSWETSRISKHYLLVDAPSPEEAINLVRSGLNGDDFNMRISVHADSTHEFKEELLLENFDAVEVPQ
jgi:hypothetical protein